MTAGSTQGRDVTGEDRVVTLDVLVVGGGVQGLVLLRELRRAGYSVALVTDADLGAGQTLHAHGILNTSYPLPRRDLRTSLERDWMPLAARTGLELYGSDCFFMAPPASTRAQLVEAWTELGYEHADVEPAGLPVGLRGVLGAEAAGSGLVKIREYTYPKRQLVTLLSRGQEARMLRGVVTAFHCLRRAAADGAPTAVVDGVTVRLAEGAAALDLRPGVVIVAAGAGTPALVQRLIDERSCVAAFADAPGALVRLRAQAGTVTCRSIHMICIRARRPALPSLNVFLPERGLTIATAEVDARHDGVDRESRRTWYVTPVDASAQPAGDVRGTAEATVDRQLVGEGLERLSRLMPSLADLGAWPESLLEVAVYAGYKQDIGSERNRPVFEPLEGLSNVAMALPSLVSGAYVNAHAADDWVRALLPVPAPETPIAGAGTGIRIGDVSENAATVRWMTLKAFSDAFRSS
jgi:glycine/D-amino acid oxidase-like deaminating enzyme